MVIWRLTFKVSRTTRKQLIANNIWNPRCYHRNPNAGGKWSIAFAGAGAPNDHENPQNNVHKHDKSKFLGPKVTLRVATWNVRTVKDDSQLHILAGELDHCACDILGISDTHRHE